MRIHVDLASLITGSPEIVQVDKTPPVYIGTTPTINAGQTPPINGKFVIPVLPGNDFPITTSSYVLPVDGGDVNSIAFSQMLSQYPQFNHVYFNPLLTPAHVAELDPAHQFIADPTHVYSPRYQTGRIPGADQGQMPTHTALLPVNTTVTPNRPGLIITAEIDLTPFSTGPDANGFQSFMAYWRLQGFGTSDDILSNYGAFTGTNTNEAAVRFLYEVDQEPPALEVFLSPDGVNWCPASLLNPVAFGNPTKHVWMAMMNTGATKLYVANLAVFF